VVWAASRTKEGSPDARDEKNAIIESEFPHLSLALPTVLFHLVNLFYLNVGRLLGARVARIWTSRLMSVGRFWPGSQALSPILQSLRFNVRDKLDFERAKMRFFRSGLNASEAELLFIELLNRPDCDWRVFYRSCFFLYAISLRKADDAKMNTYVEMLYRANSNFPVESLLSKLGWMGGLDEPA
jgi:hypothetical protein